MDTNPTGELPSNELPSNELREAKAEALEEMKSEATEQMQELADFYKMFQNPAGMIPQNREQRRLANRSNKQRSKRKRRPRK